MLKTVIDVNNCPNGFRNPMPNVKVNLHLKVNGKHFFSIVIDWMSSLKLLSAVPQKQNVLDFLA